ncbi:TIR domain-containing protein [Thermoleophilia bacterium SCSIO 60948]|nr:TIR domain-containing protein [Thermoleophilia bacterium SCSIO 60948]
MSRQVYASFHYDDVWRANVVRKSNTLKRNAEEVGFYDHSLWEEAKTKGAAAIQRLIDDGMRGAGVTVVLIGSETYAREWVGYEIQKSHADSMGMLGIHINGIRGENGQVKGAGPNPFDYFETTDGGGFFGRQTLSRFYRTYDWILDDGYNNVGAWIEAAARDAGR